MSDGRVESDQGVLVKFCGNEHLRPLPPPTCGMVKFGLD